MFVGDEIQGKVDQIVGADLVTGFLAVGFV